MERAEKVRLCRDAAASLAALYGAALACVVAHQAAGMAIPGPVLRLIDGFEARELASEAAAPQKEPR